jgi:hypothetical protein
MKLIFTALIFFIFFSKISYGQFEIKPAHLPTKINCLYVLTGDSTSEYSRALLKLLQEVWTLSPVRYSSIALSDKSLINEGNIFASTVKQNNKSILTNTTNNTNWDREQVVNELNYIEFSTQPNNIYGKPSDEKFVFAKALFFEKRVNQFDIDPKYFKSSNSDDIQLKGKFDFTDEYFKYKFINGSPGFIKNIFQYVASKFRENSNIGIYDEFSDINELKKLKSEDLLFLNYAYGSDETIYAILRKDDKTLDVMKTHINKLVKSYPYSCSLISIPDLSSKIITANSDLYYLNYIQTSTNKFILVFNAFNGKVIYNKSYKNAYYLKENDIQKLGKEINK